MCIRDSLRVVPREGDSGLLGQDRGSLSPLEEIALSLLDEGVDGPLLGGCRGGQVVVSLDRRGVVGVDRRPWAAGPGPTVAVAVERGPDPLPVNRERGARVVQQAVPAYPLADRDVGHPRRLDDIGMVVAITDPQHPAVVLRREGAKQGRVLQPAFQQPHGLVGKVQALAGGAALDVVQQHLGAAGPLDVLQPEPVDAVGNDPAVGTEQQLVGDHHVRLREQSLPGLCQRAPTREGSLLPDAERVLQ